MIKKGVVVELPESEQGKGFFSSVFLVPKEGWEVETDNKSQASEQVYSSLTLQDGRVLHPERCPKERRLDDKIGSEECILHDPNSGGRQKVAALLRAEPSV